MSLYSHLEQLRMTNERLANLLGRTCAIADAFNGSEPEEVSDRDMHKSGHTLNNQFSEQITLLQSKVDVISYQLNRIENEVLDQGTTAGGNMASRVY